MTAKANKGLKKSFYNVEAPLTAANISLYGRGAEEFDGKTVKIDMTKNLRGKNFVLTLRIKNQGGKLTGEPISLVLTSSYVRKVVRRGTDYIEDSFIIECKDKVLRIKPLLVTKDKVSRTIRRTLRNNCKKYIEGYAPTRSADELFKDVIANKIQKEMAVRLKKIYPLSLSDIRWLEFVKEKEAKKEESKETKEAEISESE